MYGEQPDYNGAWVTRLGAAIQASVTEDVIKSWQYRGWIDPKTKLRRKLTVREDGRLLLGDVLIAESHTRNKRGRSHRRKPPPSVYHKVA